MDILILASVCIVTVAINLLVARSTRGITYFTGNSDNVKQVFTAASFGQWRWPSHMHKCIENGVRTRMKDGFVLGLVVVQRILGDRTSDHATVVLCLAANTIAALLTFLIASTYWNVGVGLLAWALLLTSLWTYQLALFGTHICVAQMYFLASVYLMQLGEHGLAWYVAAGAAAGLMLFSSPSSRKYVPLLFGAFLYAQREALWEPKFALNWGGFLSSGAGLVIIATASALVLAAIVFQLSYRRIVTEIYFERAGKWLNRILSSRRALGLEHNIASAPVVATPITSLLLGVAFYLIVSFLVAHSGLFYWSQLALVLGMCGIVLLLTFPDVLGNLWAYYGHSRGHTFGRFPFYREYFASIGRPIKDDMRGGGVLWIARFFSRMSPIHFALYLTSLSALTALLIVDEGRLGQAWQAAAIFGLSVSPLLWGEITGSPQHGRSYFPGLIALVLLVAYAVFQLDQALASQWRLVSWLAVGAAVLSGAAWTLRVYVDDIMPARMAAARLGQTLRALAINEFYTYDTPYNNAFVQALYPEDLARYRIHYIDSIKDVKEGYIVVPGTSSKAINMEGTLWAIEHGDFDLDKDLDRLIRSKEIEKYAVASFKTAGTSRIWVQEMPVPSYRDLILKEILDDDRWRGRAWILDAAKLHAAGMSL